MSVINRDCPECGPQGGQGYLTLFNKVVKCRTCDAAFGMSGDYLCYIEDQDRRYIRNDGTSWGRFIEDVVWTATNNGIEDIDVFFLAAMSARHHGMATHFAEVSIDDVERGIKFEISLPTTPKVTGYCIHSPRKG